MEKNLLGYLLKALDDAEEQEVRNRLAADPVARHQLQVLRRALEPLEADATPPQPPRDLWIRALGRVAEQHCRSLPTAPTLPVNRAVPRPSWWRRADVLVAASILVFVSTLVPPGLLYLGEQNARTLCQQNLRLFHQALTVYADHHDGNLPKVEAHPPFNFAGAFVPMLIEEQLLDDPSARLTCPSARKRPERLLTRAEVQDLQQRHPEEYARLVAQAAGSYAYCLGYRNERGQLIGLRREPDSDGLPVLADCPPFTDGMPCSLYENSANHHSKGQNVLFLGGHVNFCTHRSVGRQGDDIFLSRRGRVEAGHHLWDTVLGASNARPIAEVEQE